MFAIYSDAVFISIPAVTVTIVFTVGLRIKVTKDLCALENQSGTERVCFKGFLSNTIPSKLLSNRDKKKQNYQFCPDTWAVAQDLPWAALVVRLGESSQEQDLTQ